MNYKHGERGSRLYVIWQHAKQRCLNPNNKRYKDYGGRGITICNEWLEFIPFRDWSLNNGYSEGLQINRINNDGNYEPSNCNFVIPAENSQNRRNNAVTLEIVNKVRELHKTKKYSQRKLAKKYNVSLSTINSIINNKSWNNI